MRPCIILRFLSCYEICSCVYSLKVDTTYHLLHSKVCPIGTVTTLQASFHTVCYNSRYFAHYAPIPIPFPKISKEYSHIDYTEHGIHSIIGWATTHDAFFTLRRFSVWACEAAATSSPLPQAEEVSYSSRRCGNGIQGLHKHSWKGCDFKAGRQVSQHVSRR